MLQIRAEKTPDRAGIRSVILAAFAPRSKEADLVEALREAGQATISLVAISDGQLAGHVLFSPVSLTPAVPNLRGLGLAPLAVKPELQRQGIGSRLAMRGIEVARGADYDYLVVLGAPKYYGRFGFRAGSSFGLENEYRAQDEFMALELRAGALAGLAGLVRYRPEFQAFDC
jgi:putative acetyltransferase